MSKTPRTDEREFAAIDLKPSARVVYASFAQQLETELADKDKQLAEARAEIENLKWRINSEKAKAEAALALNERALGLVNEARTDAEHWRAECNSLQRMVHEAQAEIKLKNEELDMFWAEQQAMGEIIECKNKLIEQMLEALERADELIDQLIIDNTDNYAEERVKIRAAIAAAKGEVS